MTVEMLQPLRQGVADYVRNSIWLLLEHALRLVTGLLVGVQVARHLGPEQFGNLSYALAIVSIAASLSRLGLDAVAVGRLIRNPAASGTVLRTALGLRLLGASAALGLICLLAPWMSPDPAERVYIVIIAAGLLFQTADVVDFFYQASVRNGLTARFRSVQILASAVLRLVLIWNDAGLSAFVVATLLDQILLATIYGLLTRTHKEHFSQRDCFDRQLAGSLLIESTPLFVSSVFTAVYVRIDQILVRQLLGADEIGYYVAATNLSEALYFLPTLVASAVFPLLVAASQADELRYVQLRRFLYRGLVVFGITVPAATSLMAPQVIAALYGPQFETASVVLEIHVWTLVFVAYAALFAKMLIAQGHQRILPVLTFIGLVTDIACLGWLVPRYGLPGAAWSAVLANGAIATSLLALHRPARRELIDALWFAKRSEPSA